MALGKGLNALLQDAERGIKVENEKADGLNRFVEITLKNIEANPNQPRVEFEEDALDELAESIKVHGLIQPITVRKQGRNKYQIISGERRFRASQLAGLASVPAYIRDVDDQVTLEMALIENIQREDLNAMEIAATYQRLMEECSLKQEDLGKRVGKKRSTVTNYLRLLKLPMEIQIALRANLIKMGHARTLVSIDNPELQKTLLEDILENDYSVRQVERLVKEILEGGQEDTKTVAPKTATQSAPTKPDYSQILWEEKFSEACNRSVKVKLNSSGKGQVVIPFNNESDLQQFLAKLS